MTTKLRFQDSYLGKLRAKVGPQRLIVPGFRIILEDTQGRILFIKRSDNGMWGLPAGSPELGESAEDCIRREVFEETGLRVGQVGCFGFGSDPEMESHTYPNGDEIQNFTLLVFSNDWQGTARVNDDETTVVKFLGRDELPPEELRLAHEFASIALYDEFKNSGQFVWS